MLTAPIACSLSFDSGGLVGGEGGRAGAGVGGPGVEGAAGRPTGAGAGGAAGASAPPTGAGAGGTGGTGGTVDDAFAYYGEVVGADEPVAFFRFEGEPSSGGVLSDIVGGLLGEVTEGATPQLVAGALAGGAGQAARFDGTAVSFGDTFEFAPGSPFTFEFWLRPEAPLSAESTAVFSKLIEGSRFTGDFEGYSFVVSERDLSFRFEGPGGLVGGGELVSVGLEEPPPTDRFMYVAVVSDGETYLKLYLDDRPPLHVSGELEPAGDGAPFLLGASPAAVPFRGDVDEFAIYPRELPESAIIRHYSAGRAGPPADGRIAP